jgi:hypothetical protein
MEHRQILRFAFVRAVTTVSLIGGLGFEDQQFGLREVPILLRVI